MHFRTPVRFLTLLATSGSSLGSSGDPKVDHQGNRFGGQVWIQKLTTKVTDFGVNLGSNSALRFVFVAMDNNGLFHNCQCYAKAIRAHVQYGMLTSRCADNLGSTTWWQSLLDLTLWSRCV